MPIATPAESAVRRRSPVQARSRERVERILDAAARIVVERGVDVMTTRSLADEAGVPVASLYQYFSDRDAVLLALVERDIAEMDEQVRDDLMKVRTLSIAAIVETTIGAYRKVYARRPDFVAIWLRGRTNAAIHEFGRRHNRATAHDLREFAVSTRLAHPELPLAAAELAVELGDRVFQLAYETEDCGDEFIVSEGIAMVTTYLQRYATDAGIEGVTL
jgi:AcrR family transcriptional regulator